MHKEYINEIIKISQEVYDNEKSNTSANRFI